MEEEYPAFHRWWNHPLYGTGAAGILMLQFISNECPDGSDSLWAEPLALSPRSSGTNLRIFAYGSFSGSTGTADFPFTGCHFHRSAHCLCKPQHFQYQPREYMRKCVCSFVIYGKIKEKVHTKRRCHHEKIPIIYDPAVLPAADRLQCCSDESTGTCRLPLWRQHRNSGIVRWCLV